MAHHNSFRGMSNQITTR